MLFGIFRMRGVNVQSKWESNWRPDLTMSSNVRRNCLACLPCGKDLNPMGFKHPRMRIARIYQQKYAQYTFASSSLSRPTINRCQNWHSDSRSISSSQSPQDFLGFRSYDVVSMFSFFGGNFMLWQNRLFCGEIFGNWGGSQESGFSGASYLACRLAWGWNWGKSGAVHHQEERILEDSS